MQLGQQFVSEKAGKGASRAKIIKCNRGKTMYYRKCGRQVGERGMQGAFWAKGYKRWVGQGGRAGGAHCTGAARQGANLPLEKGAAPQHSGTHSIDNHGGKQRHRGSMVACLTNASLAAGGLSSAQLRAHLRAGRLTLDRLSWAAAAALEELA